MSRRSKQIDEWCYVHPYAVVAITFVIFATMAAYFVAQYSPASHESRSHYTRDFVMMPMAMWVMQTLMFLSRRRRAMLAHTTRDPRFPTLQKHALAIEAKFKARFPLPPVSPAASLDGHIMAPLRFGSPVFIPSLVLLVGTALSLIFSVTCVLYLTDLAWRLDSLPTTLVLLVASILVLSGRPIGFVVGLAGGCLGLAMMAFLAGGMVGNETGFLSYGATTVACVAGWYVRPAVGSP